MNKPNDNTDGYQSSSILPRASKLQDVDFLLIHGTGDGRLEVFKQKKTAIVTLFEVFSVVLFSLELLST